MRLTCGPENVRPLRVFLQDLGQFAAERNRTDVVEEDRHDSAHHVQEPGDADQLTELHKNNTESAQAGSSSVQTKETSLCFSEKDFF